MSRRRVVPLHVIPGPAPVQLVLALDGGVLAALGKRAKGRKWVPGGSFTGKVADRRAA